MSEIKKNTHSSLTKIQYTKKNQNVSLAYIIYLSNFIKTVLNKIKICMYAKYDF